jgi:hypothetical protein
MHEPEESDEPTSPAMRRVFDELEAEFEAGLRHEAEQESLAAIRAEVGATVLWEQLARRVGSETVVLAGQRVFRGTVMASYPEFLVLRAADGAEHLIRHGSAVSVVLAPEPPSLRPAPAATTRRYQFALALRELARRREPVRRYSPTRPAATARSKQLAATTSRSPSMTWVRRDAGGQCGHADSSASPPSSPSRFLRSADERVLACPVGRLLVHSLDVRLELEAVHAPDTTPAELDRWELTAADQRIDLSGPDVEDRGHILQRVEPGLDAGRGHEVLLVAMLSQVAGRFRTRATARP